MASSHSATTSDRRHEVQARSLFHLRVPVRHVGCRKMSREAGVNRRADSMLYMPAPHACTMVGPPLVALVCGAAS
jgi:hypothetical protein